MSSYAVIWSEPRHAVEVGKLELEPGSLRFEGSGGARPTCVHRVNYGDIDGVRVAYDMRERLGGRPAIVLELVDGGPLRIGSVNGIGTVAELADELTRLTAR